MNKNIHDGLTNLRRSSLTIKDTMSNEEIEDAIMYFAFGTERILKGTLETLNPAFAIKSGKFEDIVKQCYSDRVVDSKFKADNAKSQIEHIAFKELIRRSSILFESCSQYVGVLHNLRIHRNILAHRSLDEFDHENIHKWLLGVYFPLISEILKDSGIDCKSAFDVKSAELEQFALVAKHNQEIIRFVTDLLKQHNEIWTKKNDQTNIQRAAALTKSRLETPRKYYEHSYEEQVCPACQNTAVLVMEPDFDYDDEHSRIAGVYPVLLECHYCDLEVSDYEYFSHLELDDWWNRIGS